MKGRSFPFKGIIAYPPGVKARFTIFWFLLSFRYFGWKCEVYVWIVYAVILYIYSFWFAGLGAGAPEGRAYKSERRADGARKKRCAIHLTRSKELFQPDARSDFLLLGPGLRPGRCGWVGSPEGVGRGSRNTLPPPLAQRSANSNKKAPVPGRSVRLYNFCENEFRKVPGPAFPQRGKVDRRAGWGDFRCGWAGGVPGGPAAAPALQRRSTHKRRPLVRAPGWVFGLSSGSAAYSSVFHRPWRLQ